MLPRESKSAILQIQSRYGRFQWLYCVLQAPSHPHLCNQSFGDYAFLSLSLQDGQEEQSTRQKDRIKCKEII